ncbi:MAG: PhoH family protein [Elusimicrobiales bacterium]
MVTKKIRLEDSAQALAVLGAQDSRLRQLERELRVGIFVRHDPDGQAVELSVRGSVSRVDKALSRIRAAAQQPPPRQPSPREEEAACRRPAVPRSPRQKRYLEAIFEHDLVIATGPAGTGKTYLAVAAALRALELNLAERIILTRPIVEAGEKLGFLPGDLYEKVHPYLRPLYDAFYAMLGPERLRAWRDDGVVEIVPLAYMRGRTLENAFIILDEAQNTAPEQMKMFLTRMGLNSKMVITGDTSQTDLRDKSQSGLLHAMQVLRKIPAVGFVRFSSEDVVRHPLVREIVDAYDKWEKAKK